MVSAAGWVYADRMDERELIRRCIEGEEEGWARFVERYADWIRRVVRQMMSMAGTVSPAGEDDLVAAVFQRLWSRDRHDLRQYDPRYSPSTWIRVITVSVVRDHLKTRKPHRSLEGVVASDLAAPTGSSPAQEETLGRLSVALERLPSLERLLLELHYLRGLSYVEVADSLKMPPNSVGPLLSRARARLLELFKKVP